MPITRVQRRTNESIFCMHCRKDKLAADMSMLSCGSPSDCCNQCWLEFVARHPSFSARVSRFDDQGDDV